MTGGSKIVGIRPQHNVDGAGKPRAKGTSRAAQPPEEAEELPASGASQLGFRLSAALLGLAGLGWSAAATLSFVESLDGRQATLADITSFLPTASAPLILIGLIWLLVARSSRGEAARLSGTVAKLRREEHRLAAMLSEMSDRLDANRHMLAEQAALMAQIGAETSNSLSDVSHAMQGQLDAINRHAATLESRTSGARSDMNGLLADMPRAHAEVHRMAELLDSTGQSSLLAANELAAQLAVLAERGRNADDIASRSAQRLAERVAHLDDMARIATARLEEASSSAVDSVSTMLDRTADAVATAHADLEKQSETTVSLIEQSHAAIVASGADAAAQMSNRLADITARIGEISQTLAAQDSASAALMARLNDDIAALEARLQGLSTETTQTSDQTASAIASLRTQAEQLAETLDLGGKSASSLIAQAEDLLTALDASVREIDESLPRAHQRLEATAAASREVARAAMPEITALETASSAALDRLRDAEKLVTDQRDLIDRLVQTAGAALDESKATAEALTREIDAAEEQARSLTGTAAPQLIDALLRIKDTANQAAEHARSALDHVVPEAAERLGAEARQALGAALAGPVEEQMVLIAQRAEQAIAAARQATESLTRDVAGITAATLGLEERIDASKDAAVRADREQFARRMSGIVEQLNNSAVDVARILATEASDTAWGAYLRGERGIFTRRAVRLISNGEARDIRRLYLDDDDFRDQVNLYIRDFETMLRNVMATRDAEAFSVTLVSSDAGKLYVALAQSIERLRR